MRSIQQNFQTAVLTYGPNEIRSLQKTKVQVLVNNWLITASLYGHNEVVGKFPEKNANIRKMT